MTVLIPDLDEEQTNAQVERVEAIVSGSGEIAQSIQSSPWGRRRLAYTIRHNGQDYRDGYYLLTYFTAMPDKTAELERDLKLDARVMRYLLVQSEPYVAPEEEEVETEEVAEETAANAVAAATTDATVAAAQQPANEGVETPPAIEPAAEAAASTPAEAGETGEGAAGATPSEATEEE